MTDADAHDMHALALGQATPAAETAPDAGLVEALTAALKPFVAHAHMYEFNSDEYPYAPPPDHQSTRIQVKVGDLRRATAALSRAGERT